MTKHSQSSGFPDTHFLVIAILLIATGIFVFMSASFGLLARAGASWGSVLFSQFALGLGGGAVFALICYNISLKKLRRFAFPLFILAILLAILVFIPKIGFSAGGASRWIHIFSFSFQPSEFLKLALIIFLASWLTSTGEDIQTLKFGLLPFICIIAIVAGLMLAEPDTGTFMVMLASSVSMFILAGGRWKHLIILGLVGIGMITILAFTRPYVRARIETFINPASDPTGDGYQIQQSLLAVGSGRISGRGFGQSVQKFQYLPEPIGDSIFAVLAEEFGLIGSLFVIILFVLLGLRGLKLAGNASDSFTRLLISGLVIMITAQAFLHIAALLGLMPLTGIPLPFISHGGTALMFMIAASALVLNASRYQDKK